MAALFGRRRLPVVPGGLALFWADESPLPCCALPFYTGGAAAMIQAALLSQLGVGQLDAAGYDMTQARDPATGVTWLALVHTLPGEPVIGNLMRCDPGTMGRTLFHFHAAPRDGRHSLAYPCWGEGLASPVLPPLPALCAFFSAARSALGAGRVPDLAGLAPLHIGVGFSLPPVEVRPGDREIRLRFEAPEED